MLPHDYRRDKARVRAAADILASATMREMILSMREASTNLPPIVQMTDSRLLGRVEGYCAALQDLVSFGTLFKPKEPLQADYTEPN